MPYSEELIELTRKTFFFKVEFKNIIKVEFVEVWEFVMDAWVSMIDFGNYDSFVEHIKHFEVVCHHDQFFNMWTTNRSFYTRKNLLIVG